MIKLEEISKSESARYMGVRGEINSQTAGLIEKYEPIVRASLRPSYVYREAEILRNNNEIQILGINMTGESIKNHLKGCQRAVIFAATVSAVADMLIRKTAVTDAAGALAVDCLCSAAVEQVCDKVEDEIFRNINAVYRTWRFSPGYGDLPIQIQGDILSVLNAQRRIGLTVTESCMLLPSKSVTAIIGISDIPVSPEKTSCDFCPARENCGIRAIGGCQR
ncbi:MAG: 5-methyltetrahydrofolate--homocysteine methyltransferase [Ruminococcus sp.]|nr:5-methyltetrahydrofolate--homocysteine methyltransferase [Ruminococcus sp.]MDE6785060.1 5-methyltetrahydrofolate--homocysteine methyltransferase [Ruminococcus sp.]